MVIKKLKSIPTLQQNVINAISDAEKGYDYMLYAIKFFAKCWNC